MKNYRIGRIKWYIVCVLIALNLSVLNVNAAETDSTYTFNYTVDGNYAYIDGIIYHSGDGSVLTVPEVIDGYTVKGIGNPYIRENQGSFYGLDFYDSYEGCDNYTIKKVILPGSLSYVMDNPFGMHSGIEELVISDGACFEIPEYPYYDYQMDSLKKLYIGSGMISDDVIRLAHPRTLEEVIVSESNPAYKSVDGVLFSKDMKKLFIYPTAKATDTYIIPNGVEQIGYAFTYCKNIKTIVVPESVTDIGASTFQECSATIKYLGAGQNTDAGTTDGTASDEQPVKKELKKGDKWVSKDKAYTYKITKITNKQKEVSLTKCTKKGKCVIPSQIKIDGVKFKVTSIATGAFKGNKKLTSVTIPSTVTKIGKQAFYNCKKLKSITIKTTKLTKKNVGSKAFKGINSKATIKVPKSKLKAYKTLLKSKGVGSKVKIKK